MNDFGISTPHLNILLNIFKENNFLGELILFGSRAKNKFRKNSDVDLCIKVKEYKMGWISKVLEDIRESDFPYLVDLINYDDLDEDFKKIVDKDGIVLKIKEGR